ncbi:MAG: hypothetical protein R3E39_28625 [Anaerolineae bacterium]
MAEMAQLAKLPLHWQTGTGERSAALTELAGGNKGDRRCNVGCAAVGSLMAAAVQKYRGKANAIEPPSHGEASHRRRGRQESAESWVGC